MVGKRLLYTRLAKYYDQIIEPYVDTEKEVRFLQEAFGRYGVKKVLDIGCGTGRHCIPLAKAGYEVLGIDKFEPMLKVARKKAQGLDASFIRKDITELNFRDKFDAVICMWSTFYYLPQPITVERASKALKPGGIFLIEGKDWGKVEKKAKVRESSIKIDDKIIEQRIEDSYEDNKRIRRIFYKINDKRQRLCLSVKNLFL